MAALADQDAVLHNPGSYMLSADLGTGESVIFHERAGESGSWKPVTASGTAVTLSPTDPSRRISVGAGTYLRATCTPDTIVARSCEIKGPF